MPDILEVIDAIVATQQTIEIATPNAVKVAKAFPYSPPQNEKLSGAMPAFTNAWSLVNRGAGPGANLDRSYEIHMQFYAGMATNGDDSRIAWIATAFMPAIQTAFGQRNAAGIGGIQLYRLVAGVPEQTCTIATLRGGVPTLAVLERGGSAYIGLDLFLDVRLNETFFHS